MSHRNNDPFVSIIILNYNGGEMLIRCLRTVLKTEYPNYEVLLVDNGSRDNSVKKARMVFNKSTKLKIVALGKNFGYAEGNNIGYRYASPKAKYTVFLNNDVTVTKDWLRKAVEILEKNESIGAASPLLGGYIDVFGYLVRPRSMRPLSHEDFNESFFASGSVLIVRRRLIDKLGLFNPNYFIYYEEIDFCWRLRLAGYKIASPIPSSRVYHIGHATTRKHPFFILFSYSFHNFKNMLYTLLVNYEAKNLVKYFPWTILSYIADMIRDIVLSALDKKRVAVRKGNAIGYMKSFLYIVVHFPDIWKDRLLVQKHIRKIKDAEIINKFIILPKPPIPKPILTKLQKLSVAGSRKCARDERHPGSFWMRRTK